MEQEVKPEEQDKLLLTDEEQQEAILRGIELWREDLVRFWDIEGVEYPKHQETYIKDSLLQTQLAKAKGYYEERLRQEILGNEVASLANIEQDRHEERERIIKMPCWLAQSHNVACPIRQALRGEL